MNGPAQPASAPPSKTEVYGNAVAALTDALHNLSLIQIDYVEELDERESTLVVSVKQSILQALGGNEQMGLADLVGMRAIDGWIEGAVFDGAYGDYAVYRYDAEGGPIYASPALTYKASDDTTTVSFWFKNTEPLIQMLVHRLGALPHLPYQVPGD